MADTTWGAPPPPARLSPRYRRQSTPPSIEWPERAEQAGGELGRLWEAWNRASQRSGAVTGRMRQLTTQLAEYEATVRTATADSDMVRVAAAQVGRQIVQRDIDHLKPDVGREDDDLQAARLRLSAAESRLGALRRDVEGEERAKDHAGRELTDEALRIELLDLAGIRLPR